MTAFSVTVDGVLDSYSTLRDAITAETDGRANTASLDRFIKQAEDDIRLFLKKYPLRPMRARTSLTFSSEYTAAPTNMVLPISIEATDPTGFIYRLPYIAPENISAMQGKYLFDNRPFAFTREGDELRIYPVPTTTYAAKLFYYEDLTGISAANSSNWLLADHPTTYFTGALYYAYRDMPDIQKATLMKELFEESLGKLRDAYPEPSNQVTLSVDPSMLQRRWLWQIV